MFHYESGILLFILYFSAVRPFLTARHIIKYVVFSRRLLWIANTTPSSFRYSLSSFR